MTIFLHRVRRPIKYCRLNRFTRRNSLVVVWYNEMPWISLYAYLWVSWFLFRLKEKHRLFPEDPHVDRHDHCWFGYTHDCNLEVTLIVSPYRVFRHFLEYLISFLPELLVIHNMTLDDFQCGEAIRNAAALAVRAFYDF